MSQHNKDNLSPGSLERRRLLTAGALGTAAVALGVGATAMAETGANTEQNIGVAVDGNYETVPLRKNTVRVTAVQSYMRAIRNLKSPEREMKANVDHMIELIDSANGFYGPQDLVCFHE